MSGGAVIDRHNRLIGFSSSSHKPNPPDHPDWSGYVNLAGFLLDLDVDVPQPSGALETTSIEELVASGIVPCDVDLATFYVDEAGRHTYRAPTRG